MADGVTFQSGTLATPPVSTKVSTDDASSGSGHLQRVKLAYSADGSDTHVPADADGLYVQTVDRVESPQHSVVSATALAAGGNSDLNAADITTGKTGRLTAVDIGASVPTRCDIQTVSGSRVTRTTVYTQAGETVQWRPPGHTYFELAGGSGIHFGVSVTNLSPYVAADVRATVYWDEVV